MIKMQKKVLGFGHYLPKISKNIGASRLNKQGYLGDLSDKNKIKEFFMLYFMGQNNDCDEN